METAALRIGNHSKERKKDAMEKYIDKVFYISLVTFVTAIIAGCGMSTMF